MKTIGKYLGAFALTAILMTSFTNANAQKCDKKGEHKQCQVNNNHKMCKHLNLTDAQTASFKKLKLEGDKKITPLKNKLNELHAKKRTLMSANNADKKAINRVITDMSSAREKIQKIRTTQRIEMRKLLNDEQRVMWDKKACNHKNKKGHKSCKGHKDHKGHKSCKGHKDHKSCDGHKDHKRQNRTHSNCCK